MRKKLIYENEELKREIKESKRRFKIRIIRKNKFIKRINKN